MFIKRKHLQVIIFSSVIITLVFIITLAGYMIYIQWKKDSFALKYKNSMYQLTADLFRNDIVVANVNVYNGEEGPFSGMPLIEGSLKNNSSKTISSILIEVSFVDPDGIVVYKDWFHPLGDRKFGTTSYLPDVEYTRNMLLPGEGVTFRHLLRNCPREIVKQISQKSTFAKGQAKDKLRIIYKIEGLSVL